MTTLLPLVRHLQGRNDCLPDRWLLTSKTGLLYWRVSAGRTGVSEPRAYGTPPMGAAMHNIMTVSLSGM